MKTTKEREAISEVFKLFSVLFDGPPSPLAATEVFGAIFPQLSAALCLPQRQCAVVSDDLGREYESLFLVPERGQQLSLYSTSYASNPEEARFTLFPGLMLLAETLRLPWKKDSFVPGRAYPTTPDHLSVELGILSSVVLIDSGVQVASRSSYDWNRVLTAEISLTLKHVEEAMLAGDGRKKQPGYFEVVTIARSYVKAYREFDSPEPSFLMTEHSR